MFELPFADPGAPELRSASRFMGWIARKQLRVVVSGACFGILWMTSQAAIPLALGGALGAMVRRDKSQIIEWSLVLLALGILQAVAGILRHRRAVANFLQAVTRVEQLVAKHAGYLGGDLARRVAAGEVASLGSTDVERIGDALDVTARTAGGIVSYVAVSVVLLVVSPPLGAIVVLGVPVCMALVAPLVKPLERRQTAERERRAEASSLASDTVAGLRVLRGLGGERVFAARFERASESVADASIRTAILQSHLDGAEVLLPGVLVVGVTWLGAHFAVRGSISPGELVAFYASAAFLLLPMQTFVEAASKWTAALVASRRIITVLSMDRTITDPASTVMRPETSGSASAPIGLRVAPASASRIAIPVVERDFLGATLTDELSQVAIEPGVFTAVVPATPEEGSALLDRLGRFEEPPDGKAVRLGNTSLADLPVRQLRRHVVVLERSPVQMTMKVAEVLVAAGSRTAEVLEAAAATELVQDLPDGRETELSERWRSLSGGQRQRLALAQALAGDPDVLLLDDPTSAVDAHTEAAIADRLRRIRAGRTTVVTTTSPLLLARADRVILLDEQAVAVGTHVELLGREERYRDIVLRGTEAQAKVQPSPNGGNAGRGADAIQPSER
jgi:ABC-type multidrug transport system fused ATPase/permease subunit